MKRTDNRTTEQIRTLRIETNVAQNAPGSVLLSLGATKVLCTVSLTNHAPQFLKNKRQWWLTSSYALLPGSTIIRTERESCSKKNERSIEISRLIGRSLRSIITLPKKIDEKTIHIDCDVIQADGGTRTACITGAFVALSLAEQQWLKNGILAAPIIQNELAAISVGIVDNVPLLDLDFEEDTRAMADFNYILTRQGDIVELQGAAEQHPISWFSIEKMYELARKGVQQLFDVLDQRNEIIVAAHKKDTTEWIL